MRDALGNMMAVYTQSYTEITANQTVKEIIKLNELHLYGSSRLGISKPDKIMATQEYSITGYDATTMAFTGKGVMHSSLVLTPNPSLPTIYTIKIGRKEYEVSNHLGNVLATFTDRRIARDDNRDLTIDYYNPDLLSTTDYYAFGSPMPGRGGIQKCSTVTVTTTTTNTLVNEDFNSGGTGGFVAAIGARDVSNVSNGLRIRSIGNYTPMATRVISTVKGTTYTINLNITDIGIYSQKVMIKVTGVSYSNGLKYVIYTTTGPIVPITFTPTGTSVTFEISAPTTGDNEKTIDIDNFSVSYVSSQQQSQTVCSFIESYRYGFNGKELDKGGEGMGGGGSTYDYGFRIYNPSLGKFLSVDPLTSKYPWYTPYQFAGNMPIWAIDLDGCEEKIVTHFYNAITGDYTTSIKVLSETGELGHGTLHKYVEQTWDVGKKFTNGNYSWWEYSIIQYNYKADYFEEMSYLDYYGSKWDEIYNDVYRKGQKAKSGGIGISFRFQVGPISTAFTAEIFGNSENSAGINCQFEIPSIDGKFEAASGKVKPTLIDYLHIGCTIKPYVFLGTKSIDATDGWDLINTTTAESTVELSSKGKGVELDCSVDILNGGATIKIGPTLGREVDLSKSIQTDRANTSKSSQGFSNKTIARWASGQLTF